MSFIVFAFVHGTGIHDLGRAIFLGRAGFNLLLDGGFLAFHGSSFFGEVKASGAADFYSRPA
jgi:hypothetical protein